MSDKITIIERSIGDFPALIGKVRDGDKLSFLEKTAIKMLNGQERRQTSDALRVFSGVPDDIRIIFHVSDGKIISQSIKWETPSVDWARRFAGWMSHSTSWSSEKVGNRLLAIANKHKVWMDKTIFDTVIEKEADK